MYSYKATNVARTWAYILDAITQESTTETSNTATAETTTEHTSETTRTETQEITNVTPNPLISTFMPTLSDNIPEHDYLELYGPDFRLPMTRGMLMH